MKTVVAKKAGFYETLRQSGEVFCVPKELEATWFEALEKEDKGKAKKEEGKDT